MTIEINPDQTVETGVPTAEAPVPPKLPLRFWIAVDTGLMTQEQALVAWTVAKAAGEKFDPLG